MKSSKTKKRPSAAPRHLSKPEPKKKSTKAPRAYFVHPRGMVDKGAKIGARTRVWACAHVQAGAVVGSDCNICESVFVEAGAVMGNHVTVKNGVQLYAGVVAEDYVFIGPNATFTNDLRPRVAYPLPASEFAKTHIERGASIGANATIVAGHVIGGNALVGAGAVVTRDVPAHALVVGNPARQIGWVCACGTRLDDGHTCPRCGKTYQSESSAKGLRERLENREE